MKDNYSYVCTLSTDDFIDGVLVLNENLKMINSKYNLLCLINETISEDTINVLDFFNIKYKKVKKVKYSTNIIDYDYWRNTYDIINVFNLTEFKKIIYLDLDLLINENIDHLFESKPLSMVRDVRNNNELFNTGVMIIEPNKEDYKNLIDLKEKFDKEKRENSVKEVINEYFGNKINELEKEYNVQKEIRGNEYDTKYYHYSERSNSCFAVKNLHEAYYGRQEKEPIINHYCGKVKPFIIKGIFDCENSILYIHYLNKILRKKQRVNYGRDLISIIIPVYNQEDYLDSCLKSIFNQTYPNIELILVNDGSTDKSLEIMEKYHKEHKNMKIISIPNQGVSHARNTGLDNATGKYITFVDSDDVIDKNTLEILYKDIVDNNVDIVQCNNFIDQNRMIYTYGNYRLIDEREIYYYFLREYIGCTIWGKLYRREILEETRFNEKYNNHEDELFLYEVIKKCKSFFLEKDFLYYYTWQKENSLTKKKLNKKDTDLFILLFNDIIDYTLRKYPDLLPTVKNLILSKLYYLRVVKHDLSTDDFDLADASPTVKDIITDYLKKD